MTRALTLAAASTMALVLCTAPATALPTMIRLGYIDCASCHYSPQGGGPLNPYGRTIDEGQSLRAGEYRPRDSRVVRALSWNGRIAQDLRFVFPTQRAWAAHDPTATFRPRVLYRNVTELSRRFAAHLTITGEADSAPQPALSYDPAPASSSPVVNVALLRYRISPTFEVYAGRDQLPIGASIPDPGAFVRQRNDLGFYDAPAQVKVNWTGKRHRVVPFAYAPGGNEPSGDGESGAGTIAEVDPTGSHRAVIGASFLGGRSASGRRYIVGAHARIGFGSWGVLAEHDLTLRDRDDLHARFGQHASYGQIFWAAREWLVASAFAERLWVQRPFDERLTAGRVELAARLTSVVSAGIGAGWQRNAVTRRASRSLVVHVALKTVY